MKPPVLLKSGPLLPVLGLRPTRHSSAEPRSCRSGANFTSSSALQFRAHQFEHTLEEVARILLRQTDLCDEAIDDMPARVSAFSGTPDFPDTRGEPTATPNRTLRPPRSNLEQFHPFTRC